MRIYCIISFLGCLLLFGTAEELHAQAVAAGKVIDTKTGEPLRGAHVYLSGTQIGTATDARGEYRLPQIPAGGYRVIVSMVGYGTTISDLIIGPDDSKKLNFELKPAVYELPEIYVGNLDKRWEKDLERFTDYFIGQTEWADSVKILNPEVLRFNRNWWGKFTAEALAPLRIENRALGYRILYHLKEFEHTGARTRWDGDPLFSEIEPASPEQAAYWDRNREAAFYGSLRHFLLALLSDRVKQEGFIIYNRRPSGYKFSSEIRSPASADRLVYNGSEEFLYDLNFHGQLEIIYTREEEPWHYVQWSRDSRGRNRVQTSYLELNDHPATVDSDGEFIEPYGATQFGYFAYSLLADATPREYRPEGYQE